jgi:hypothetical protein
MKVLLAGEFSGVHNHLKRGLVHHGVHVLTVNTNDAWKKFPSDVRINSRARTPFRQLSDELGLGLINYARRCERFDVLQLMNPVIANTLRLQLAINNIFLHKYAVRTLVSKADKTFLLGAGDDYFYFKAALDGLFAYSPVPTALKIDMPPWKRIYSQAWTRKVLHRWNLELIDRVNRVIPCAYEYGAAYAAAGLAKASRVIRFPFSLDEAVMSSRSHGGKIRVLHTPTRPGFKGTALVLAAFAKVRINRPDVEFIEGTQQNIVDYQKTIDSVDIIVDQVYSYSYAMNAIYSLASGKVVLTGFEDEARQYLGVDECPAILNVKPEVDDIVRQLVRAIETVRSDREIREKARAYVERYHCAKMIAAEYLSVWGEERSKAG